MAKDREQRMQGIDQVRYHPFFKEQVDWQDVKQFMGVDPANIQEDDQELIEFYTFKYNIGFYAEDIGIYLYIFI